MQQTGLFVAYADNLLLCEILLYIFATHIRYAIGFYLMPGRGDPALLFNI